MEINYLLLIYAVLMIVCIIRGAHRGLLRILFGIIAWVFLICFVNFGSSVVADFIKTDTQIPTHVEQAIDDHLHNKYEASEKEEEGSGKDAVMENVPSRIKDNIEESVQSSIDKLIKAVAQELADAAINGISTIIIIVIGIILIFLIDKLIKALGYVPGLRDVNRLFGIAAGAVEGLLIIWLSMYIADCFPTSFVGSFIISYTEGNYILQLVYQNNVIEQIIGI